MVTNMTATDLGQITASSLTSARGASRRDKQDCDTDEIATPMRPMRPAGPALTIMCWVVMRRSSDASG